MAWNLPSFSSVYTGANGVSAGIDWISDLGDALSQGYNPSGAEVNALLQGMPWETLGPLMDQLQPMFTANAAAADRAAAETLPPPPAANLTSNSAFTPFQLQSAAAAGIDLNANPSYAEYFPDPNAPAPSAFDAFFKQADTGNQAGAVDAFAAAGGQTNTPAPSAKVVAPQDDYYASMGMKPPTTTTPVAPPGPANIGANLNTPTTETLAQQLLASGDRYANIRPQEQSGPANMGSNLNIPTAPKPSGGEDYFASMGMKPPTTTSFTGGTAAGAAAGQAPTTQTMNIPEELRGAVSGQYDNIKPTEQTSSVGMPWLNQPANGPANQGANLNTPPIQPPLVDDYYAQMGMTAPNQPPPIPTGPANMGPNLNTPNPQLTELQKYMNDTFGGVNNQLSTIQQTQAQKDAALRSYMDETFGGIQNTQQSSADQLKAYMDDTFGGVNNQLTTMQQSQAEKDAQLKAYMDETFGGVNNQLSTLQQTQAQKDAAMKQYMSDMFGTQQQTQEQKDAQLKAYMDETFGGVNSQLTSLQQTQEQKDAQLKAYMDEMFGGVQDSDAQLKAYMDDTFGGIQQSQAEKDAQLKAYLDETFGGIQNTQQSSDEQLRAYMDETFGGIQQSQEQKDAALKAYMDDTFGGVNSQLSTIQQTQAEKDAQLKAYMDEMFGGVQQTQEQKDAALRSYMDETFGGIQQTQAEKDAALKAYMDDTFGGVNTQLSTIQQTQEQKDAQLKSYMDEMFGQQQVSQEEKDAQLKAYMDEMFGGMEDKLTPRLTASEATDLFNAVRGYGGSNGPANMGDNLNQLPAQDGEGNVIPNQPADLGGDVFQYNPYVSQLQPGVDAQYQTLLDMLQSGGVSPADQAILDAQKLAQDEEMANLNYQHNLRGIGSSSIADQSRMDASARQRAEQARTKLGLRDAAINQSLPVLQSIFGQEGMKSDRGINDYMKFYDRQFQSDQAQINNDTTALSLMLNALGIGTINPSQPNYQLPAQQPGTGYDIANLLGNVGIGVAGAGGFNKYF